MLFSTQRISLAIVNVNLSTGLRFGIWVLAIDQATRSRWQAQLVCGQSCQQDRSREPLVTAVQGTLDLRDDLFLDILESWWELLTIRAVAIHRDKLVALVVVYRVCQVLILKTKTRKREQFRKRLT